MKKCNRCKKVKSIDEFYKDKKRKDGLYSVCKKCHYETSKEYQPKYQKEYRIKNKEKLQKYCKEWKIENREKVNQLRKEWDKEYRQRPEVIKRKNELEKIRRKEDIKYRLDQNISGQIRKLLKSKKAGRRWETLVGYTLKDLMERLECQFKKGMCWNNYGKWHIDHKKPKSLFKVEEFKDCWCLANLQPLWARENLIKNNKY